MAWSRAFQKCIIYHFLDFFVLQTFLLYNWILQKKISIADSKNRAQELSNDVSFVIFGHHTWDLEHTHIFFDDFHYVYREQSQYPF